MASNPLQKNSVSLILLYGLKIHQKKMARVEPCFMASNPLQNKWRELHLALWPQNLIKKM